MKNAIISGANGFIGKHLVSELLKQDWTVYALVRDKNSLNEFAHKSLRVFQAQAQDYKRLDEIIKERDIALFYHLSWDGTFGESFKNYELQMKNAVNTADALMSAIKMKCKKFIMAGTMVEIEVKNYMNKQDISPRISCIYGMAKAAAEMLCKILACNYSIEFNCAILANVYGEGDKSKMVQNAIIDCLNKGISPKLIEGNTLYDWLYVKDAVQALIAAGLKGVNMKTYYAGHRQIKTFKEIVKEVGAIINPNIPLKFGEYPDNAQFDYSKIDLDELYRDSGFEAKADFKESILNTAQWVKSLNWK